MQTIFLSEPYDPKQIPEQAIVLAAGFFDGVHQGHQKVITTAKKLADQLGCQLAVMTFDVYPGIVFKNVKASEFKYLTTLAHKQAHFARLGVDLMYVVSFNQDLIKLSPQAFVDQYFKALHVKAVVAGADFTYGKKDIANMSRLPTYAKEQFKVVAVDHLMQTSEAVKVSSTAIRDALANGQITHANQLLGYVYQTHGQVVQGKQLGRTIGFPTLNIATIDSERLPTVGVYAVQVKFANEEKIYQGMASIGHNETIGHDLPLTVEVNLFDFNQDVYGREVTVFWEQYLRPMEKFGSLAELTAQLQQDQRAAQAFFQTTD